MGFAATANSLPSVPPGERTTCSEPVSPVSSLGSDQLVKDLHTGTTLDHVMDSIYILANATFELIMKRKELIEPNLNPPYTRLCKDETRPPIKLFRDDLSGHLK